MSISWNLQIEKLNLKVRNKIFFSGKIKGNGNLIKEEEIRLYLKQMFYFKNHIIPKYNIIAMNELIIITYSSLYISFI